MPDKDSDEMNNFVKKLATVAINLKEYVEAYNDDSEQRLEHSFSFTRIMQYIDNICSGEIELIHVA